MTWYNNSWNYRKAITVSNSGSTLPDYQVSITIDKVHKLRKIQRTINKK